MDATRRSLQASAGAKTPDAHLENELKTTQGAQGEEAPAASLNTKGNRASSQDDTLEDATLQGIQSNGRDNGLGAIRSDVGTDEGAAESEGANAGESADEGESDAEDAAEEDLRGDVTFGDMRWYVMDEIEGCVLLWTVDAVDIRAFNDEMMATTWLESDLLAYLNVYFVNHHIPPEQRVFIEKKNYIGKRFVESTTRAFVPSIQEMQRLLDPQAYDERRIACIDGEPVVWWLRTMQGPQHKHAAIVTEDGTILLEGKRWENGGALEPADVGLSQLYRLIDLAGVRPCMWVRKEAFTCAEPEGEAAEVGAETETVATNGAAPETKTAPATETGAAS